MKSNKKNAKLNTVSGVVSYSIGGNCSGLKVQVFDRDMRQEELLSEVYTDSAGRYEAFWEYGQLRGRGIGKADLSLKVWDHNAKTVLYHSSVEDIRFNASSQERIDVVILSPEQATITQYANLLHQVSFLAQPVAIPDLMENEEHQDISFISRELGVERSLIVKLVWCHQTARAFKWKDAHAELLYGLVWEQFPADLKAILSEDQDRWRAGIDKAAEHGIVTPPEEALQEEFFGRLIQKKSNSLLYEAIPGNEISYHQLFTLTDVSERDQRLIIEEFSRSKVVDSRKWLEALHELPLSEELKFEMKLSLELSDRFSASFPLLDLVRKNYRLSSVADLSQLNQQDWFALLKTKSVKKYLSTLPGKSLEAKAQILERSIAQEFPVQTFYYRVLSGMMDEIVWVEEAKMNKQLWGNIHSFFSYNPHFEINIPLFENSPALKRVNMGNLEVKSILPLIQAMHRVFNLSAYWGDIKVLLKIGIRSAQDVVFMGKDRFVREVFSDLVFMFVQGDVPQEEAEKAARKKAEAMYNSATQISRTAGALSSFASDRFQHPDILHVVGGGTASSASDTVITPVKDIPELSSLFGQTSYCSCQACVSVYSPAAYLVDLLHFLSKNTRPTSADTLLDSLLKKRPEIENILLNCKNSFVEMPYTDLVLEILENAMRKPLGIPVNNFTYREQTSWEEEELAIQAEHRVSEVYQKLKSIYYPQVLPFDLDLEIVRLYISEWGMSRREIMEVFFSIPIGEEIKSEDIKSRIWKDTSIASEVLNLESAQWEMLQDTFSQNHPWNFFGVKEHNNEIAFRDSNGSEEIKFLGWKEYLSEATIFLKYTGLKHFAQAKELLDMSFVNPGGKLFWKVNEQNCDIAAVRMQSHPGGDVEKAFRSMDLMIRLSSRINWSFHELDLFFTAFGIDQSIDTFNEDSLFKLSHLVRLKEQLHLSVEELVSFWAPMNTQVYVDYLIKDHPLRKPLYQKLFLDKSIVYPLSTAFLENGVMDGEQIDDHRSAICAAMKISGETFLWMTNPDNGILDEGSLTLENLSRLFRYVLLSRSLQISVEHIVVLSKWTNRNPFDKEITQLLLFLDEVEQWRSISGDVDTFDYVLRNQLREGKVIRIPDEILEKAMHDLNLELKAIKNSYTIPLDLDTNELLEVLGAYLESLSINAEVTERFKSLLQQSNLSSQEQEFLSHNFSFLEPFTTVLLACPVVFPEVGPASYCYFDAQHKQLCFAGKMNENTKQELLNLANATKEYQYAVRELFKLSQTGEDSANTMFLSEEDIDEWSAVGTTEEVFVRVADFTSRLNNYLRRKLMRRVIVTHLSELLSQDSLVVMSLLNQVHKSYFVSGNSLLSDLETLARESPDYEKIKKAVRYLERLDKLCKIMELTLADLQFIVQCPEVFKSSSGSILFSLSNWPESSQEYNPSLFFSCLKIFQYKTLQGQFKSETKDLRNFLGTVVSGSEVPILSEISGWDIDVVSELKELSHCGADCNTLTWLERFQKCMEVSGRSGIWIGDLFTWAAAIPSAVAPMIIQALRNNLNEKAWNVTGRRLRDKLRDKQREVLVACLRAVHHYHNSDSLFEDYLVDVEMGSCRKTTRIRLAIDSVQLFVNRSLLNLEGDQGLTEAAIKEWEWMKNYRVWEANRKVFLYPENYIEPELRDDKTPLFKEFENELRQNKLDDVLIETSFLNYLEKLEGISRLQVCGMYEEEQIEEVLNPVLVSEKKRVEGIRERIKEMLVRFDRVEFLKGGLRRAKPTPSMRARNTKLDSLLEYLKTKLEQIKILDEEHEMVDGILDQVENLQSKYFDLDEISSLIGELNKIKASLKELSDWANSVWARLEESSLTMKISKTFLHVFARTRDTPHDYYYRKLVDKSYWTPWESIPVDIEGDHLIPIVYNRRLYLFWPTFDEETESVFNKMEQNIAAFVQFMTTLNTRLVYMFFSAGTEFIDQKAMDLKNKLSALGQAMTDLFMSMGEKVDGLESALQDKLTDLKTVLEAMVGNVFPDTSSGDSSANNPVQTLVSFVQENVPSQFTPSFQVKPGSNGTITWQDLENKLEDLIAQGMGQAGFVVNQVPALVQQALNMIIQSFPKKKWIIGLSYAAYRNNKWSGKKISNQTLAYEDVMGFFVERKKRLFSFKATASNRLRIWCFLQHPGPYSEEHYRNTHAIGAFELEEAHGTLNAIPRAFDYAMALKDFANDVEDTLLSEFHIKDGEPHSPWDTEGSPQRTMLNALLDMQAEETTDIFEEWLGLPCISDFDRIGYRTMAPHQYLGVEKAFPLFFTYKEKSFYADWVKNKMVFWMNYHPYISNALIAMNKFGVDGIAKVEGLYERDSQYFSDLYQPQNSSGWLAQPESFDFSTLGLYAQYNWEVFFHAPFLIANRLSQDQKFRESMSWYHYIFNPTVHAEGQSGPQKFWITKPFKETTAVDYRDQEINRLLNSLQGHEDDVSGNENALITAIRRWRENAFNPYVIARTRTTAFQKAVVMKYLDNLIAWGDYLFKQEDTESINEASQLYVFASKILGQRPQEVMVDSEKKQALSWNAFNENQVDAFSNVNIENLLPSAMPLGDDDDPGENDFSLHHHYFCVPPNKKLLQYWDLVEDRLFKIRHCMNIEGVDLEISNFGSPIDPAVLVKAKGLGINLQEVVNDLNVAITPYRFSAVLQKANEFCQEVRSLGAALLVALEKRDAEDLLSIRNNQELKLLEWGRELKKWQLQEANLQKDNLMITKSSAITRLTYYSKNLIEFMNPFEAGSLALNAAGLVLQSLGAVSYLLSGPLSLVPNFKAGFVTTLGAQYGGQNTGDAAAGFGAGIAALSSIMMSASGVVGTVGSYVRRAEDWVLQIALITNELKQLDKQLLSADIKISMAERELQSHELQITNNKEIDAFMKEKFTNQELYDWMITELSKTYFDSYQIAFQWAKSAQKCFDYELGNFEDSDRSRFVLYGRWDSLRKGLLAGEQLQFDLKKMESSYYIKNVRDQEISKYISLSLVSPEELLQLKKTGKCEFSLPEVIFDMDFPGQFKRRIKAVTLTIPCIVGPYSSVCAKLTLLSSRIRKEATIEDDDECFHDDWKRESVSLSGAQRESGLFTLNFQDERYLPFEGRGVISRWKLELPATYEDGEWSGVKPFDYDTLSDVIVEINYTAREGSDAFADKVKEKIDKTLQVLESGGLSRMISLKQEFPETFFALTSKPDKAVGIALLQHHFPYFVKGKNLQLKEEESIIIFISTLGNQAINGEILWANLEASVTEMPSSTTVLTEIQGAGTVGFSRVYQADYTEQLVLEDNRKWMLQLTDPSDALKIEDIAILFNYGIKN